MCSPRSAGVWWGSVKLSVVKFIEFEEPAISTVDSKSLNISYYGKLYYFKCFNDSKYFSF